MQGEDFTVTVTGQITGLKSVALDFECGIEYSTTASFEKDKTFQIKADNNYTEGIYTVTLFNLISQCNYYYRAYYINQLVKYYGETKQFSFFWEMNEDFLIGSWTANTWNYLFTEEHTGTRSREGRTQSFTWSLSGYEIELSFKGYEGGIDPRIIFVIDSFTTTDFKVYDKDDPNKELITFTKRY